MAVKRNAVLPRTEAPEYVSFEAGMQTDIVELLNSCFGEGWCSVEDWEWKHARRPGFDKADVGLFVAGDDCTRRFVACFHMELVPFQLAPGLRVMTSMEGDFAVAPEFRGLGLPDAAHVNFGGILMQRGAALRIGFSIRQKYERLYRKRFGHIAVPLTNVEYFRRLDSSRLRARVSSAAGSMMQHLRALRRLATRLLRSS